MKARRGVVFVSAVVATVLALTSAAFACGVWEGKFTVRDSRGATTYAYGYGGPGMFYCDSADNSSTDGDPVNRGTFWGPYYETAPTGGGASGARIDADSADPAKMTFEVMAEPNPATECNSGGGNQLPEGVYSVNFISYEAEKEPPTGFVDCMNGTSGGVSTGVGIPLGTITVNDNGYSNVANGATSAAWKSFSVAALQDTSPGTTQINDASAICIAQIATTSPVGISDSNMQVPVTFI